MSIFCVCGNNGIYKSIHGSNENVNRPRWAIMKDRFLWTQTSRRLLPLFATSQSSNVIITFLGPLKVGKMIDQVSSVEI